MSYYEALALASREVQFEWCGWAVSIRRVVVTSSQGAVEVAPWFPYLGGPEGPVVVRTS